MDWLPRSAGLRKIGQRCPSRERGFRRTQARQVSKDDLME